MGNICRNSFTITLSALLLALATAKNDGDGSGVPLLFHCETNCKVSANCFDDAAGGSCGEDGIADCAPEIVADCAPCFPSSQCGTKLPFCIEHDGLDRCWAIHVPETLPSPPSGLVMDLHGYSVPVSFQEEASGWKELADEEDLVVVWPQGASNLPGQDLPFPSWNAGLCCGGAKEAGLDDVGFLREVVKNVTAEYGIDPGHVYWTGDSNGCTMAQRMAAEAGDIAAAVACHGMYLMLDDEDSFAEKYSENGPVPVLEFHGTHDDIVGYNSFWLWPEMGARKNQENWASRNGCAEATTCWIPAAGVDMGYEISASDGSSCDGGSGAALITLPGLGHTTYAGYAWNPPGVPDTTQIGWAFMSRFPVEGGNEPSGNWHGECGTMPEDVDLSGNLDLEETPEEISDEAIINPEEETPDEPATEETSDVEETSEPEDTSSSTLRALHLGGILVLLASTVTYLV